MAHHKRPVLVFDGDCNFCRRWVGRWRSLTGDKVEYLPSQQAAGRFPQLKPEQVQASVILIEPGYQSSGAQAVFRALAYAPGRGWLLWLYRRLPPFAAAAEFFYRFIAGRRTLFSRLTRWLWGEHLEPPSFFAARWLFLRGLGLIYLAAFLSLWVQVDGLVGQNGILPVTELLKATREQLGDRAFRVLPTLCWVFPGDAFLRFLCWGGALLSGLVVLGIFPGPILLALWAFYLSLTAASRDFLSFQWDILLLETGFLAAFVAPWSLWPRLARESFPAPAALWLLRWLLFRLMFESGCVKLLSGDAAWWSLSALDYHYETQPLPTWIGWYAHQLPGWFQKLSVAAVFAIELLVPFLVFAPRRARMLGCGLLVLLQALIALTGNYCFFNALTLALCLFLLDDAFLKPWLPKALASGGPETALPSPPSRALRLILYPLAGLVLMVSLSQLHGLFRGRSGLPAPLASLYNLVAPFHTINSYGLFAVMTTSRLEISVEGSADGVTWSEYSFKWKPGDLKRRPGFVAPHQPRLDWQMWFAALGSYQQNPWFLNLLVRLLQGRPEVLRLFAANPFPVAPPSYLRATAYDYRFTSLAERRATGAWWKREPKGLYCPVVTSRR